MKMQIQETPKSTRDNATGFERHNRLKSRLGLVKKLWSSDSKRSQVGTGNGLGWTTQWLSTR